MSTKSPAYDHKAFPKDKDRLLGKGRSGVVKKVRRISDGKVLACKKIYLIGDKKLDAFARREREIHRLLDHPNILRVVDVVWEQDALRLYSEFCAQGTLQDVINQQTMDGQLLSESYIWAVLFQLTAALFYCHTGSLVDVKGNFTLPLDEWNPILHRDIKPANVMLNGDPEKDPSAVKLGDFGLGLIIDNDAAYSTYVGTLSYMAPEISRMQAQSIYWTEHCDIFSLGCTIYHLCALRAPFDYRMESEADNIPRIPDSFSDSLQKCVESCLAFKPIRRKGLLFLLQHAKSRVSFASEESLIQVKEDNVPEGPDQHNQSVPSQTNTEDVSILTPTSSEDIALGANLPQADLKTPTNAQKNTRAKSSQILSSSRYRRGNSSVTLPERPTSGTAASIYHTLQFGTFTAGLETKETPSLPEPLASPESNVSSESQTTASRTAAVALFRGTKSFVGPSNVAPIHQALFEALSRTHSTRWDGNKMVISDTFLIEKPYFDVNVKLLEGRDGDLDRMRRIVDMERRKTKLRLPKEFNSGSSVPPPNDSQKKKPLEVLASNQKPIDKTGTGTTEAPFDLEHKFRQFADKEKQRVIQRRNAQSIDARTAKLNELIKFSQTFKLKTPVPTDLIGILAKDPSKQEDIVARGVQQQYDYSTSAGGSSPSSATVANTAGVAQALQASSSGGKRKNRKRNKAPQAARATYTNSVLDFARED